jgi:hypothetical protein
MNELVSTVKTENADYAMPELVETITGFASVSISPNAQIRNVFKIIHSMQPPHIRPFHKHSSPDYTL